ncbi:alcohol dehydrogenase catalytic domain-containing protein [Pseudomonadota bacterium]
MKAAQFVKVGAPLELIEIDKPTAAPGYLVFKVNACGICGSDLHNAETGGEHAQPGTVFGHEYSGEVVEVGAGVDGWKPGDRLIGVPVAPCGTCPACQKQDFLKCHDPILQGFDLRMQGAYAEYSTTIAAMAIKLPDGLGDVEAATVEPLAVGLNAWRMAQVPDGSSVLILGAGIIGLSIAKWARFYGATTVGISEIVPARIERAVQVGADVVINAADHADPVAEYQRQTGQSPSVIFECIGRPIIDKMIEMAPRDAQLVCVGTGLQKESFTVLSAAFKQLRMAFPIGYEPGDFDFILQMIAQQRITINPLISASVGLDEVPKIFELLGKPNDHCKVVITP